VAAISGGDAQGDRPSPRAGRTDPDYQRPAIPCGTGHEPVMERKGFEPSPPSPQDTQLSTGESTESGSLALSDPVAALLAVIRTLTDPQRAALLAALSVPTNHSHATQAAAVETRITGGLKTGSKSVAPRVRRLVVRDPDRERPSAANQARQSSERQGLEEEGRAAGDSRTRRPSALGRPADGGAGCTPVATPPSATCTGSSNSAATSCRVRSGATGSGGTSGRGSKVPPSTGRARTAGDIPVARPSRTIGRASTPRNKRGCWDRAARGLAGDRGQKLVMNALDLANKCDLGSRRASTGFCFPWHAVLRPAHSAAWSFSSAH
jgi:hypothetical protein